MQTARFRQFWDEAAKSRHIVEAVPGNTDLQPSGLWLYVSQPYDLYIC